MKVKSMRIPEDIEQAIDYISKSEKIEKVHSLRKLARLGFELYVAKAYQAGNITLREAAELLNISLIEAIDNFSSIGIPGNTSASDVLSSLDSLSII